MRLGLVARADNTGLGVQTFEFYRHMQPAKTMLVDISSLNKNRVYPERYPDAQVITGFPGEGQIRQFLAELDVVFIAESSYTPLFYLLAKELGVKVAVQYNYEFFDWISRPEMPRPDLFIAPSKWHYGEVDYWCKQNGIKHIYLHCPVARENLPFREILQFKTFLHPAGRSAAHDRNGTETVIKASKLLKSDAKIVIHFQGEQGLAHQVTRTIDQYRELADQQGDARHLEITQKEYDNYADVYKLGDALVLPRRYGGNCLPLNEALSCGLPVLMPDIFPNRSFLPHQWLMPAGKIGEFTPRTTIDIYSVSPSVLANHIDRMAAMGENEAAVENRLADRLAESISWPTLKRQYELAFEELCTS